MMLLFTVDSARCFVWISSTQNPRITCAKLHEVQFVCIIVTVHSEAVNSNYMIHLNWVAYICLKIGY